MLSVQRKAEESRSRQQCSLSGWENDMVYRKQPENDAKGYTPRSQLALLSEEEARRGAGPAGKGILGGDLGWYWEVGFGGREKGTVPTLPLACLSSHPILILDDVVRDERKMTSTSSGVVKVKQAPMLAYSERSTKWLHAMCFLSQVNPRRQHVLENVEPSYIARGHVRWCSHLGK